MDAAWRVSAGKGTAAVGPAAAPCPFSDALTARFGVNLPAAEESRGGGAVVVAAFAVPLTSFSSSAMDAFMTST